MADVNSLFANFCPHCGSNHIGTCVTEGTLFIWTSPQNETPHEVEIVGSWLKWQKH